MLMCRKSPAILRKQNLNKEKERKEKDKDASILAFLFYKRFFLSLEALDLFGILSVQDARENGIICLYFSFAKEEKED